MPSTSDTNPLLTGGVPHSVRPHPRGARATRREPSCCAKPAPACRAGRPGRRAHLRQHVARAGHADRAARLGHGRGAPPGERGHVSRTARRLQRRATGGQRLLHRHSAGRRPVEQHQGLRRRPRGRATHRRPPPLPAQDRRDLSPPRRRSRAGGQEAPGGDRRRTDADHHQVRRERSGLHQRLRTRAHR